MCGECAKPEDQDIQGECVTCSKTSGGFVVVIALISFLFVAGMYYLASKEDNGSTGVMVYYTQIALLIAGPSSSWTTWTSAFSISPTSSNYLSTCVFSGSDMNQVLMPLLISAILVGMAALCSLTTYLVSKFTSFKIFRRNLQFRTAVAISMFSYTSLTQMSFSALVCLEIDGRNVLYAYPSISCESGAYKGVIALMSLIIVFVTVGFAALTMHAARKIKASIKSKTVSTDTANSDAVASVGEDTSVKKKTQKKGFKARWGMVTEPFSDRAYYYSGVVLGRRAIYSAVNIGLILQPSIQRMMTALCSLAFLILHLYVHPFKLTTLNLAESFSLLMHVALAIIVTPWPKPYPVAVEAIICLIVALPSLLFVAWRVHLLWVGENELEEDDFTELGANNETGAFGLGASTRMLTAKRREAILAAKAELRKSLGQDSNGDKQGEFQGGEWRQERRFSASRSASPERPRRPSVEFYGRSPSPQRSRAGSVADSSKGPPDRSRAASEWAPRGSLDGAADHRSPSPERGRAGSAVASPDDVDHWVLTPDDAHARGRSRSGSADWMGTFGAGRFHIRNGSVSEFPASIGVPVQEEGQPGLHATLTQQQQQQQDRITQEQERLRQEQLKLQEQQRQQQQQQQKLLQQQQIILQQQQQQQKMILQQQQLMQQQQQQMLLQQQQQQKKFKEQIDLQRQELLRQRWEEEQYEKRQQEHIKNQAAAQAQAEAEKAEAARQASQQKQPLHRAKSTGKACGSCGYENSSPESMVCEICDNFL
jgi:hypothetical protein